MRFSPIPRICIVFFVNGNVRLYGSKMLQCQLKH
uniref:Uncharacterized protein n=1 Tax=Anguilla anguilla TaxID=7936 RepID=A0A0E9TYI1_ANGAN